MYCEGGNSTDKKYRNTIILPKFYTMARDIKRNLEYESKRVQKIQIGGDTFKSSTHLICIHCLNFFMLRGIPVNTIPPAVCVDSAINKNHDMSKQNSTSPSTNPTADTSSTSRPPPHHPSQPSLSNDQRNHSNVNAGRTCNSSTSFGA